VKVHIIGIAGSGKSTLARSLAAEAAQVYDLDRIVYDAETLMERPTPGRDALIDELRNRTSCITEGAYHDLWLTPLLDDADVVVWLDPPLWRCLYRMVRRHFLAEMRRDNPHPGWLRLWRFLQYTCRSAARQRAATELLLAPYARKVRRCGSQDALTSLRDELLTAQHGPGQRSDDSFRRRRW
jgi:adenylate kinase family enzyme